MKNYNNPSCKNIEEFQEDFNRIKYIKRLFNRYETTGILRERLILNHIITFYNVFGLTPSTRMLFNRIDEKHYSILKTFLTYLNYCPENKFDLIDIVSVPLDTRVIETLRSL
jgi:sulfur relay (sulfurtransferase) DsrC/TusE family protein